MNRWELESGGKKYRVWGMRGSRGLWIHCDGKTYFREKVSRRKTKHSDASSDRIVVAPMPGKVTKVSVSDGDQVVSGQLLVLMEAMKMEYRITAPRDSKVVKVFVDKGDQVELDAQLVELAHD